MNKKDEVVHVLWHGKALCGFSDDEYYRWPEGHGWTGPSDINKISCEECRGKAHECFEN